MSEQRFPAIDALIRSANQAAGNPGVQERGHVQAALLAQTAHVVVQDGTDPLLVMSLLLETTVDVLVRHIPIEQRSETMTLLIELLADRLKANGL